MSRIGKLPVDIPTGVTITVGETEITVAGPKGTLKVPVQQNTSTKVEENKAVVTRKDDEPKSKAWHGLQRALLQNAITGVTKGFEKKLEIQGVGYRAQMQGTTLNLQLGYSHPVNIEPPAGIQISVDGSSITIAEYLSKMIQESINLSNLESATEFLDKIPGAIASPIAFLVISSVTYFLFDIIYLIVARVSFGKKKKVRSIK